jgi:hypothetical protein
MKYRGYTISHEPKPIPDRSADFDFSHEDFDGAPDSGDNRCGTAGSIEDACEQIDDILEGAQIDLFEHIAATIFDWDYDFDEGDPRVSEADANALARRIMTLVRSA